MSVQLNVAIGKFVAALTTPRTNLGKLGITGGVEIDLTAIPENVLTSLLCEAIEARIQAKVKTVPVNEASPETCRAAAEAARDQLYSGISSKAKGVSQSVLTRKARTLLRQDVQAMSPERVNSEALNKRLDALFEAYKRFSVSGDKELEPIARIVQAAYDKASKDIAEQTARANALLPLLQAAPLPAAAPIKRAAPKKAAGGKSSGKSAGSKKQTAPQPSA